MAIAYVCEHCDEMYPAGQPCCRWVGCALVHGKVMYALAGGTALTSDMAKAHRFATSDEALAAADRASDGRANVAVEA